MKFILGLISAMIFVYVGVNIPGITDATKEVAENVATNTATNTATSGISGMSSVLMIVFAACIIFGLVKQMTSTEEGSKKSKTKNITIKLVKNAKELVLSIKQASDNLSQYINNLDELLGIQTVNDLDNDDYGLKLEDGKLLICGDDIFYDWYITEKHPDMDIFKIVGLHKKDSTKNKLYLLGKIGDKTFLYNLPENYIDNGRIQECVEYAGVDKLEAMTPKSVNAIAQEQWAKSYAQHTIS
jgi:hypothetical protein